MSKLKESNGDLEDLNACFLPIDPFSQLQTEYEQTKFYKEQLGLIVSYVIYDEICYKLFLLQEPMTIQLGSKLQYQRYGSTCRLIEVKDTFQYVPLLPNLQRFLSNTEVFKKVKQ